MDKEEDGSYLSEKQLLQAFPEDRRLGVVKSYQNLTAFSHCTSLTRLTPECGAQDLRVEPFLVLANLWRVALRAGVDGVDVDHRALPGWVGPQGLRQPGVVSVA